MRVPLLQLLITSLPLASTSPLPQSPPLDLTPLCPPRTHYYRATVCPSGFAGCLPPSSSFSICATTALRFSNDCASNIGTVPTGVEIGHWHTCANGFKGCTTDGTVCDKPSVQVVVTPKGWVTVGGGANLPPSPSSGSGSTNGVGSAVGNGMASLGTQGSMGGDAIAGSGFGGWTPEGTGSMPGSSRSGRPSFLRESGNADEGLVSVYRDGGSDGRIKTGIVEEL
ncbi:hypothetical protein P152DRAFT_462202 [Eremomyces bilateralis CBS 781.70]|uniref:Uncharacterized protein n=1 Tax=Eremomyces bilateralis CBS 781.70 TaxID=1392243 RepID=A0A6G1FSZ2_9PEZI|nr:uncharacterized protein P152DRAFT_462202 [Eremomyces bilateralis CBS 781.70]KAF1808802.1 hypothetical protein P152DRAFT_462202 [Eremomyces bilateralis CBS 781.70]